MVDGVEWGRVGAACCSSRRRGCWASIRGRVLMLWGVDVAYFLFGNSLPFPLVRTDHLNNISASYAPLPSFPFYREFLQGLDHIYARFVRPISCLIDCFRTCTVLCTHSARCAILHPQCMIAGSFGFPFDFVASPLATSHRRKVFHAFFRLARGVCLRAGAVVNAPNLPHVR
jgi:hypothetical protein